MYFEYLGSCKRKLQKLQKFALVMIKPLVTAVPSTWFVQITWIRWLSQGKFVYFLANILLMTYQTSRYINTIGGTSQSLVQWEISTFCLICETHGTVDLLFSMATTKCTVLARPSHHTLFICFFVLLKQGAHSC